MTLEEMRMNKVLNKVKKTKKNCIVLSIAGMLITSAIGFTAGYLTYSNRYDGELSIEMQEFLNFYNEFKNNYYQGTEERILIDGLYSGLTNSVGDDFTFYTSAAKNESQNLSTSGVGFGLSRSVYYGNAYLEDVYNNSPASNATIYDLDGNRINSLTGLKEGDIITSISNDEGSSWYVLKDHLATSWSLDAFTRDAGTTAYCKFKRGENEYIAHVVRGYYNVDKVKLIEFDKSKKEAVFQISSFLGSGSETTPAGELYSYLKGDIFSNVDSLDNLVLDLRGNGGGYVYNFQTLMGLFHDNSDIAGYYRYQDGSLYTLYAEDESDNVNLNDKIKQYTLIIDQNSASATESFVMGMRDSSKTGTKVKVVGEISYGKGRAQTFKSVLNDGSTIRYTFAQVLSPKQNCIDKIGIIPDKMTSYKSIQDDSTYYTWRKYIPGVTSNDELSDTDKNILLTRISLLTGSTYSFEDGLKYIQKNNSLTVDGIYNQETADKLQALFSDYYHSNGPTNPYNALILGSNEYDVYTPVQMAMIKKQIAIVQNKDLSDFTSFRDAVIDFKGDDLYDLETSYTLGGRISDLRKALEYSVITEAKI